MIKQEGKFLSYFERGRGLKNENNFEIFKKLISYRFCLLMVKLINRIYHYDAMKLTRVYFGYHPPFTKGRGRT